MIRLALLSQLLAAQQLSFVACPIVQDTKTEACWLAEYEGEFYYLGAAQSAPQQSHDVLVEGTVKAGPKVCGGIPLSPLTISVLPELNRGCNTVLPAKEGIEAPPPEKTEPTDCKAFACIDFEFDSDRIPESGIRAMERASATHPAHIDITIARGSVRLSDGRTLIETEQIAARRAQRISAALEALGIPQSSISVKTQNTATRRAQVSISP